MGGGFGGGIQGIVTHVTEQGCIISLKKCYIIYGWSLYTLNMTFKSCEWNDIFLYTVVWDSVGTIPLLISYIYSNHNWRGQYLNILNRILFPALF